MNSKLLPLLLIIFLLCGTSCKKAAQEKTVLPPNSTSDNVNVILIIGDDVGYEIPTCNGGQSYSTPYIDTMAKNGMRFTHCYSAPLCAPSRAMLLTGKYNFRNYYLWGVLNRDQLTIGNLLQNNGYKTYYAGKWQLNGGDASIKKFGFQHYMVWLPFKVSGSQAGSRYKSPHLYSKGAFIADALTKDKYSEDIYTDSIERFITQNAKNKFFVYYAMNLTHKPFTPTPDNNDYKSFNSANLNYSNVKYFPGMVNYMDKEIGKLIKFLKGKALDKNTVIIYVGDNGTPVEIQSRFNGITIQGKKGSTTTYGTHVPLIFYWPGKILPGSINNNLVSFPDFLPTLASITHSTISNEFKPIDGISFYNQLFGNNTGARSSIFCDFRKDSNTAKQSARWVQDTRYKLYDTLNNIYHKPGFYDMQKDIEEKNPLPDPSLTQQQKRIKQNFRHILDSLK